MLNSTTLKGLDEALLDLQKAIEHLPDGPKRKRLMDRFQRLREGRDHIDNPRLLQGKEHPWLIPLLALLMVAFFMGAYVFRKTKP